MRRAGFNKELLDATLAKLEKVVRGLEWRPGETAWTGYGEDNSYDAAAAAAQGGLRARGRRRGGDAALTWDVGCNDGTYARIAAEDGRRWSSRSTPTTPRWTALYRRLRDERRTDILPLVMSVTDPSPDLGWRGLERASLERRGTPDLALSSPSSTTCASPATSRCASCSDWVRSLDAAVVIEFPDRADPMVQRLLGGKRDGANPDYEARGVRARARGALRRRAQRGGVADADALRGAPAGVTPGRGRRLRARRPAPRRPVGARLRPAAVRPARAQRAVLRRARQHARRHPPARARLRVRPAAARRGARVGARADPAGAGPGAPRSRSSACSSAALVLPPLGDALGGSAVAVPSPARSAPRRRGALRPRGARARLPDRALARARARRAALPARLAGARARRSRARRSARSPAPRARRTPIVQVVIDELPETTIDAGNGTVDAALFPNLARFARDATWYRNATTVDDLTAEAVPAQLTGELPERGSIPTTRDHPRSLFTLFRAQPRADGGGADHRPVPGAPVREAAPRDAARGWTPCAPT